MFRKFCGSLARILLLLLIDTELASILQHLVLIIYKLNSCYVAAHTPDNTFLGFVIEQQVNSTPVNFAKENIALVYGKVDKFWKVGYALKQKYYTTPYVLKTRKFLLTKRSGLLAQGLRSF